MPIGIIVNSLSVLAGGVIGSILGEKVPEKLRKNLPLIFGISSMAMGVSSIIKMKTMPAVILSVILGSIIGELSNFENAIEWMAGKLSVLMGKVLKTKSESKNSDEFIQEFISIVVLFCASGTGIYGALQSGISGDNTILFTKSFLDFFTAIIFATTLEYMVAAVSIPQFIIMAALFCSASLIMPFVTSNMIIDFSAVGGIIMLATGFRICNIKAFPSASMIPAMILVMPLSYLCSLIL